MNSLDLDCRCLGMDLLTPCQLRATQEDGYCDPCRERRCEQQGRGT